MAFGSQRPRKGLCESRKVYVGEKRRVHRVLFPDFFVLIRAGSGGQPAAPTKPEAMPYQGELSG
jgi:hypothetical protein